MIRWIPTATSIVAVLALALAQSVESARTFEVQPRPQPVPDGRPAILARAVESSCNECHAAIVAEWAATTHALAWENEPYQEDLQGRKKAESCHGCHAPVPLHLASFDTKSSFDTKPQARDADRHFGVSCESCHVAPDGAMLGPTGAATDAHPTRRGGAFVGRGSNALCAACHRTTVGPVIGIAKDFELSEMSSDGATCVECHMGALREVAGSDGPRVVRSHELQTPRDPRFLASAFEISAVHVERATDVRFANRAGHRVPGLVGRGLTFKARALDAAGKELAKAELRFDTESYLPMGESVSLRLEARAERVELVGWHDDPRLHKPVRFLELELRP